MAWVFLQAGLEKWAEGGWGDPIAWSLAGFLNMLLLFGLAAWGAGRLVGVDGVLEETRFVRSNPWLRYLLG
ncbi:hypothetical protein AB7C87_01055 [Natrarchaeobius sp. A-rgal3]|uniref:hypothetical protein n=1 Tax=Natrarchaeobius versutus TaxID=1679078 RepID=UPI003510BD2D